ncbi:sorting nexin-16-like [Acanthochromis polyacanthus]|uniref:sorting nexin-16-like n=1 Tax=Acanthochromis polyacanthus TaxID=80966 RepID=UPI002234AB42|nr:sorting nexin-16-like [Acanthochromis polyacanthus]
MAFPFVPVPFPVDWSRVSRSCSKRASPIQTNSSNCENPALESSLLVRRHGPWGAAAGSPTLDETWSGPRGDVLDGSPTLLEGEGRCGESWIERPNSPTLLGYEILEERPKFTVYKILVVGSPGGRWVIFRRYTDFCRLSIKLKELFPSCRLTLPPKRWLKDNYEEEFLEKRQAGLQTFLQNLMLHKDVIRSEALRHFLCLVDPPNPFDSLEESRAFCEALEETNHRFQRELVEKQTEADRLKKTLEEKEKYSDLLVKRVKSLSRYSESFDGPCETTEMIPTDVSTQREGFTDVDGFQRNGDEDDGRKS